MREAVMIAGLAVMLVGAAPPLSPGTVAVQLLDDDSNDDANDQPFVDAVGQALGDQDFTLLGDHSRYVAEVHIVREAKGPVTTRVTRGPTVAGIGSFGPAVTVPLGSRKTAFRTLVATTLTVTLTRRGSGAPLWTGSAMTANIEGEPVAGKLARAAFATYPQTLGRPVSVP